MSEHDRGAFGKLLAEAKELGVWGLEWYVDLIQGDEMRWRCTVGASNAGLYDAWGENGRTGEEAFRALVERIKADQARCAQPRIGP